MSNVSDEYTAIFSPGYYIKRALQVKQIPRHKFEKEIDINTKTLNLIINDQKALDEPLIRKLAAYFGTSTDLWRQLNLNFMKGAIEKYNELI